ncbi:MAG: hypothetical protein KQH83_00620 [Actinobacteria bacterium]|nr:hypothetical protein [Actinomycetota bacterium]
MSGEIVRVRDHTRPCEHGSLWQHWFEVSTARWWQEPDCPGGREMVLRRRPDGAWEEIDDGGAGE